MKTLRQLIAEKNRPLISAGPEQTVFDALNLMAKHNVGAILVLDKGALLGIFSERDYARKVVLYGKTSKDSLLSDLMTTQVCYVTPDETIENCMALMTEKHFRHLPVIDDNEQLLGIVSIGDLVKETIGAQQFIIDQLEHYIHR